MTTILRIDASSRLDGSYSRQIGDMLEKRLAATTPSALIIRRDLGAKPVEQIRSMTIAGYYTPADKMTVELMAATALSDEIIGEVKAADMLLITTPMYNFSIPSALKAWIDQLVRIGQTFSYDGKDFTGLLPGKKAYVVVAFGAGGYTNNGPFAAADFVQPYLRFLLGFLGITDVTFITVENTTGDGGTIEREVKKAEAAVDAAFGGAARLMMEEPRITAPASSTKPSLLSLLLGWFGRPRAA